MRQRRGSYLWCRHRQASGLTLVECLMALSILSFAVLTVSYAIVAGQAHAHAGHSSMRAIDLAQDLLEEILSLPAIDPNDNTVLGPDVGQTTRTDFDNIDDFHGYVELPGAIADFAGNLYGDESQVFTRSVTVSAGNESISGIGAVAVGWVVTITVTDMNGQAYSLTRLVPTGTVDFVIPIITDTDVLVY